MNRYISNLVTLIALLFVNTVYASFDIRAEVKSGGVRWENVTLSHGKMVPSAWGIPPSLQSATAWSAASFSSTPLSSMTLIGGSGERSTPIPINISGVQYNSAGIAYTTDSNPFGGGCTLDDVALPIISVGGPNCISSTKLINTKNSSPFVFLRPMFEIVDSDVISALNGLAEGVYSASIPINIRYFYESNGISTFRNINEVMIFSFNYTPVQLDSIDVIGDGIMVPTYDEIVRRVSATTTFNITAYGYFDDGIILKLPIKDYELVHSSEPGITIPYNITCTSCNSTNLVEQGTLLTEVTSISAGTGVQTNIGFSLMFDYDISGESIISGDYFDVVTIMLEPSI
ncbi:hypothetical protein ERW51_08580 [Aliivibrio finisterrensis]|uniref:hypothetical protein n=1 Tax=Aliivibrio finisterrensis TaxID=511998 RepID=UPI00101F48A3|nr:hypothetical protein [Aliivibrio finisterrensis]RYU68414.1 hypothetical protein ERW54_08775 [Aliivibrio finisterrensis]RYU72166.1 hypothetical protein ERW51_08580 [Aliivibrio finisterrensis]RYU75682.1 hypothetical protein ERW48_07525 [Aliivibrio finisterrensis]